MKMPTLIFLMSMTAATAAFAQQQQQQQRPPQGEHRGPPQAALDACKGKKDGDTVQVKRPDGETMSATCRLVALPSHGADDSKGPPRDRQRQ
jgi:hypothetical protein